MKSLLKSGREAKGLKTREVSELLKIDQALISKFENGQRNPTFSQLLKLGQLYEIDIPSLEIAWLKNRILDTVKDYDFALSALKAAEQELSGTTAEPEIAAASIQKLMDDMEALKSILATKK